jgi:hypothetical protein
VIETKRKKIDSCSELCSYHAYQVKVPGTIDDGIENIILLRLLHHFSYQEKDQTFKVD